MGSLEPRVLEWVVWAAGMSGGCVSVYGRVRIKGWGRVRASDTGVGD